MAFVSAIDTIGSGLTAQNLRLDVISENIVKDRKSTRLNSSH